jgi:Reverse transcriptase (RNA-dependent DNA polymerase)/gag-polypeptide of LTR copia-type
MESVKLPCFSGKPEDFGSWKLKITAFWDRLDLGPELLTDAMAGSATQQRHIYSDLVLALPKDCIYLIQNIPRADPKSGFLAWKELLDHYEDAGIDRRADLEQALQEPQRPTETCMQFYSRLVTISNQLADVGESTPDSRLVMKIISGLRPEYIPITANLDETDQKLTLAKMRQILSQKGTRIERRHAAEASGATPPAAAFSAESEPALMQEIATLRRQLSELQAQGRPTRQRGVFNGNCFGCGKRGHRRTECPERGRKGPPRGDGPVAAGNAATVMEHGEEVAFASTLIDNPFDPKGVADWWLEDSGASAHMNAKLDEFLDYEPFKQAVWVKGISCYAMGKGRCRVRVKTAGGDRLQVVLHDVLYVPDLSSRAAHAYHRLFSVQAAKRRGHTCVFSEQSDYMLVHGAAEARINMVQASGLTWLVPVGAPADPSAPAAAMLAESDDVHSGDCGVLHCCCAAAAAAGSCHESGGQRELWHRRLGHLGSTGMDQLLATDVTGLGYKAESGPGQLPFCEACVFAKSRVHDIPRTPASTPDPVSPFHTLGLDLWGPMHTPTLGGRRYSIAATCFKTRYLLHDLLRTKDEAVGVFRRFLAYIRSLGHSVRVVRVDNDSVLLSNAFYDVCNEHGISVERTAPYSHWQHGRIERQWRTLSNMAHAMLGDAGLELGYWGLAMSAAVYIRNRVWSSGAGGVPLQMATGRVPDLSDLRVFGCPAYVHIDSSRRRKLEDKAWKGVFVGYAEDSPAWLVYNPETKRVLRSRDVDFDEGPRRADVSGMGESADAADMDDAGDEGYVHETVQHTTETEEHAASQEGEAGGAEPGSEPGELDAAAHEPGEQPTLRRGERHRQPPGEWWIASAHVAHADEPQTYRQAVSGPDASHWLQAMQAEAQSLISKHTWDAEVDLPPGRKAIGSKWVFKVKRDSNGNVQRYKARLVAQGFTQQHGIDYTEVFAPVVKQVSIRTILALAAYHDWEIEQLDVETAFLYAPVEEEIFMRLPEGLDSAGRGQVVRLRKALYGLKQAPRNWNKVITQWLLSYGFTQSQVDPGVYVYNQGGDFYILALYVDDSILVGRRGPFISKFKQALRAAFNIQDLGAASFLLGMTITRDRHACTLTLAQRQYIMDMLQTFNMASCKPVSTPMSLGHQASESHLLEPATPYQQLVGSLLYLSVCTRPDISMAVSMLSCHMSKPTRQHWELGKRVLRYLAGSADVGLVYGAKPQAGKELVGYSDADWAGDATTRRSRTGYVFMLNGAAVSWRSQRQQTVALSTAEAEYMALTAAIQEAVYLRQLLTDLGEKPAGATVINEDNQGCIALSRNSMTVGRSKHIDIKYHFSREKVESGEVDVQYCPTEKMLADQLTKPLAGPQHQQLCRSMMGLEMQ